MSWLAVPVFVPPVSVAILRVGMGGGAAVFPVLPLGLITTGNQPASRSDRGVLVGAASAREVTGSQPCCAHAGPAAAHKTAATKSPWRIPTRTTVITAPPARLAGRLQS